MEYGFDNYNKDNEVDNYSGYIDESWFYQDPYFFPQQDMTTQHMVEEAPFEGELFAQRRPGSNMGGMPTSAPPAQPPSRNAATFRVDANSIRHCLGRFTYIWQDNRMEYWMVPINVSRTTVTGFRWHGRRGWSFAGVSLDRIASFTCI